MTAVLVTGAMGCIGAWTLYHLVKRGLRPVSFDLSPNRARLNLLMSPDEQEAGITFVTADLTDFEQVRAALNQHQITHLLHLAALQVPFCRANPVAGAQVNVVGTVNVFEAARHHGIQHLAQASSIAIYGAPDHYPPGLIGHDAAADPHTLYGVYKLACEGIARVYWEENGVSSTTLRPYTVYGLGRDQGLTSEPTKAMQAAACGEPYHIGFGGTMQFQWASDVAEQFIDAAIQPANGANAFNLGGEVTTVDQVAAIISELCPGIAITVEPKSLPFPIGFDDHALRAQFATIYETPLREGIQATIRAFTSGIVTST